MARAISTHPAPLRVLPPWWIPAAIVLLSLLAYLPALRAGFIWDDDDYVLNNVTLRDAAGLARIWIEPRATPQYYPLVHTTFWVEHKLWGLHPAGYHATNVLLHALAAVCLGRVLLQLHVPGAWLAATLFAVHPVEVESVAWVTERKNVLSGVLYLAAASCYLRFALREDAPAVGGWRWYAASLLLFVAALLSKTVTCTLPAALLLVLAWKQGSAAARHLPWLLPMFVFGVAMGLFTAEMERSHVGAAGSQYDWTWAERVLIAGRAVWFYLAKVLWPTNLAFIYPRWEIDTGQWWQWLFPLAAVGVLPVLWWGRGRWGGGPLVAALYFGGTLFPALGFFNVFPMKYSFVADHFQYLASIGPIALVAAGLTTLAQRAPVARRPMVRAATLALIGGLAAVTAWRTTVYRDPFVLWHDTIAKNPTGWMPHYNLACQLELAGRYEEALHHYQQAWQRVGDESFVADNIAGFLTARGIAAAGAGDPHRAVQWYREALAIKPDDNSALNNWGLALEDLGQPEAALERYRAAAAADPRQATTRLNLGNCLLGLGQVDAAVVEFERGIELDPTLADAHRGLGVARAQQQRFQEAAASLARACQLAPHDWRALANLARVHAQLQQWDLAARHAAGASRLAAQAGDTGMAAELDALAESYRDSIP